MNNDQFSHPTLLRLEEVLKRVALSKSHIYNLMKVGEFPTSVRLCGNRAVAWIESEITAWVNGRLRTTSLVL